MLNTLNMLDYLLQASLRMAMPILIASLGLAVTEKSGVLNIACEGIMLTGALEAVLFARFFHSPWAGLLGAGLTGLFAGFLFGLFTVFLKTNQIVTGIAFNFMALGLTSVLNRLYFGLYETSGNAPGFARLHVPFLSDVPVLGVL